MLIDVPKIREDFSNVFHANVLKVMIASPGDVAKEREIVTQEIHRWNDANASARRIVLLPIKWETHSTPELGNHPQAIINRQLLEDADIVIGIFGTKIGTPTTEYISGTVEEIKRHVARGKTAKLYFSDVPVPPSQVNETQLTLLRAFKQECQSTGLYATFTDHQDFAHSLAQHLSIELNQPRYMWLAAIEQVTEDNAPLKISPAALRLLKAVSDSDGGTVILQESIDRTRLSVGSEDFIDGTARSEAKWRGAIDELEKKGLFESVSQNVYRVTDAGYQIADDTKLSSPSEPTAFELSQDKHIRDLLQSTRPLQRDFLRFLLIKGGQVRGDVYFNARKPQPTSDWNDVVVPLVSKGLIKVETDHKEGISTAIVNFALMNNLTSILFPRGEEQSSAFEGI